MKTQLREENERIQQKKYEALKRAYENMDSALNDKKVHDGINAILKFLNEKGRVNTELPISDQLEYIEENMHIKMRYVELDEDWFTTSVMPMLVKTVNEDWLAVIPNTNGSCVYISKGKRIKITSKNAALFTNSAMYFYKGMKNGKITALDLFSFIIECSSVKDRIVVLIACAATVFAGMLLPWVNSFIFMRIIPTGEASGMASTAALIFSVVTFMAILKLLQSLILTNSMLRTGAYVQSSIFSKLLSLKSEFFKKEKSGEISNMIMRFTDISKIISVKSVGALINMILSLLYFIQVYIYAPQLLRWVIIITVVLSIVMITEGVLNARWLKSESTSLSKMSGFCYELFSGIEQVKLNGAEMRMMKRWSDYYLNASRTEDKPFFLKYARVFYKLISIFSTVVIFIYGAGLEVSNYIAFSAAYGAFLAASAGIWVIIDMVSSYRSSYTLIKPIFQGECEDSESKEKIETLKGEISISDLYFRYDKNSNYVLNGLSTHIYEGESVGIIGASGCGKTTLIRLLLGFEKLEEGSIYIDGFDIRELDLKSYRKKNGVILQNTGLISGDIYSNITITKPDASMEDVYDAIEKAGLTDVIKALPMGIHTPVSQENCTLSGGQRQRIFIARAIIAKPSILIFDEATSALDNITQAKITESINNLECTKIIVSHRLSTIESCDRILVMDKGEILQEGTYEKLKEEDRTFQKLLQRQLIQTKGEITK